MFDEPSQKLSCFDRLPRENPTESKIHPMTYIAARREDGEERRRAEILDAAEALYIEKGWAALTGEQTARLSRALVYVYFRDKQDLLFAIGERVMRVLHNRIVAAISARASGIEQVDAIGWAYLRYANEFPRYFDFCSRFQSHSATADPSHNERACKAAGDQIVATVARAVETGIRDRSIRGNVRDPMMFAVTLWAFMHGTIQLTTAKKGDLARRGIAAPKFNEYAFPVLRRMAQLDKVV